MQIEVVVLDVSKSFRYTLQPLNPLTHSSPSSTDLDTLLLVLECSFVKLCLHGFCSRRETSSDRHCKVALKMIKRRSGGGSMGGG